MFRFGTVLKAAVAILLLLWAECLCALNINGIEYVGVGDFARMAGMKYKTIARAKKMSVFNANQSVSLEVNSRVASVNGVFVNLGHPVAVKKAMLYVSKRDIYKNLYPVLFPKMLKNARAPLHIVIDAGHGGKDEGAKNKVYLVREKNINLDIALRLGALLRAKGYKVSFTRTGDTFIDLEMRPILANKRNADLFISVHSNSAANKSVSGVETYALTPVWLPSSSSAKLKASDATPYTGNNVDGWSQYLSYCIQRSLKAQTLADDRGARRARFAVLRTTNMPACLVEVGFLSNNAECLKLASAAYRQKVAAAIANGVANYAFAAKSAVPKRRK